MYLENEQDLLSTVRNAPIGICILNASTLVCEMVNDKYLEVAGKSYEEVYGKLYWEVFAEARQVYEVVLAGVIKNGNPFYAEEAELTLKRHGTMERVFITFVYSPIKDADGSVKKVAVWALNNTAQVTSRERLEETNRELAETDAAFRIEQKRLKSFFMEAPAGICILDGPELVFEMINPLYQQLFPGRELLGKPLLNAVPEVEGTPIWDILQGVLNTGNTYYGAELLIPLARTDDGPVDQRYFNFIYQARRNTGQQVDGILVFVIEVTDKVLADKKLQNTADTLKLAMETANMGTWYANLDENTLTLAERSRRIHGIPDEVNPTLMEAAGMIPVEDRQRVLDEIFEAASNHREFDIEYQIYPMTGEKPKWIRSTGMGYYGPDGTTVSILGTIFDITEQKEDDLRKNDFIGMVSHELKTPLTTLNAVVQAAGIKLKNNPDKFIASAMEIAAAQVKKMVKMINGFLNVSRLESGKIIINKENFDLGELLDEMIRETEITLQNHVIHYDSCHAASIHADRDKIGSVISNLLSNAIKYSPKSKIIDIRCLIKNNKAIVSIQDYGLGVKRQDQQKLFDRYYRVESTNTQHISGFGIGLYLSAEIIRRHEGEIWVESEYGSGSTFYFSLPLSEV